MAQTYGSSPLWHRIRTLDRTSLFIQQDEQSDNSLDAKADKIYKYFTNNNELCGLIHFDNGKGMEFPSIIIDPKNMKSKTNGDIGKNHIGAFQTIFSSKAKYVYIYSKILNGTWKMTRINIKNIYINIKKFENGKLDERQLTSKINGLIKRDIEEEDDAADEVFTFEPIKKFLNNEYFEKIKETQSGTIIVFEYEKNNCPFYDLENKQINKDIIKKYSQRCSYTYDSDTINKFKIYINDETLQILKGDYLSINKGYKPLTIKCYYTDNICVFEYENKIIVWQNIKKFKNITGSIEKYDNYRKWKYFNIKFTILSNDDSEEQIKSLDISSKAEARFPRINIIFGDNENTRTIGIPNITYPKKYLRGTKYLKLEPFHLRTIFELNSNYLRDFGIKNNKSNPNLDNLENNIFKIAFEKIVYPIIELGCDIIKIKQNKGIINILKKKYPARTLFGEIIFNNGIKNNKYWNKINENIKEKINFTFNKELKHSLYYPIDIIKQFQLSIKNAKKIIEQENQQEEDNSDNEEEKEDEDEEKEDEEKEDEEKEDEEKEDEEKEDEDEDEDEDGNDDEIYNKNQLLKVVFREDYKEMEKKINFIRENIIKLNDKEIKNIYKVYSKNFHEKIINCDDVLCLKSALPYFIYQLNNKYEKKNDINSKNIIENIYNRIK